MTRARTLADMISDGVIGTTELADDAITPVKLDETGNYTIAQLGVNGTVTADGLTVDGDAFVQGSSGATLTLKNTNTTVTSGDLLGQLDFYNSDPSGDGPSVQARIKATSAFSTGNGASLGFFTTIAGSGIEGAAPIERMKINQSGDISFYEDTGTTAKFFWDASAESLGIGTSNITRTLNVTDSTNDGSGGVLVQNYLPVIELDDASAGGTSTLIKHDTTDTIIENSGNGTLKLSASKAMLNTTAHTPNDTELLVASEYDASGTTDAGITLSARQSGNWRHSGVFALGQDMIFTTGDVGLNGAQSSSEKMRLDTAGALGIGASDPSAYLHIAKPSGGTIINLQRTNTNTTGSVGTIQFSALDDHAVAAIAAFGDGDDEGAHLSFRTTSAASTNSWYSGTDEAMRINSAGKILIDGTVDPGYGPLVIGNTSSASNIIQMLSSPSGYNTIHFGDGTSGTARYAGFIQYNNNNDSFNIGTATGTPDFVIDSNGNLAQGAVSSNIPDAYSSAHGLTIIKQGTPKIALENWGVRAMGIHGAGSSSENSGIVIYDESGSSEIARFRRGGGLTFNGDTAAANALDDYETGTWDPYWGGDASNPTASYTNQNGWYVKIGKQVWCGGVIHTSSASGGSGNLLIRGFPFYSASDQANEVSTLCVGYANGFSTYYPTAGYMGRNRTFVNVSSVDQSNGTALIQVSYLTNTSYLNFNITYTTD